MKAVLVLALVWSLGLPMPAWPQNCCAPAVPQQGALGETLALPHTLEIGLYYEYLRAQGLYAGSGKISDPGDTRSVWKRGSLNLSYGLSSRFSASAVIPFVWKAKERNPSEGAQLKNTAEGVGDVTLIVRTSLIPRNFVNYRELSLGFGMKLPTGAHDRRNFGFLLPPELQPGSGSWDWLASAAFYQGYELVDFLISTSYVLTSAHDDYEFGNQFAYTLAATFHVAKWLDLGIANAGSVLTKDQQQGCDLPATGKRQFWLSPTVQLQLVPQRLRFHIYGDFPIYQHFNGTQLGSDYNIRLSLSYLLSLVSSEENE